MQVGVADALVAEGIEYREQEGGGGQEQDVHNGRSKHGGPEHRAASRAGGLDAGPCYCNDTDRKSTRLNSSHSQISYAVFCLKKKRITYTDHLLISSTTRSLHG